MVGCVGEVLGSEDGERAVGFVGVCAYNMRRRRCSVHGDASCRVWDSIRLTIVAIARRHRCHGHAEGARPEHGHLLVLPRALPVGADVDGAGAGGRGETSGEEAMHDGLRGGR